MVTALPFPSSGAPSESIVACAGCGASHGAAVMRLGRRELALDPAAVAAVRRTLTGALELTCRRCGHATAHRNAALAQAPARAA